MHVASSGSFLTRAAIPFAGEISKYSLKDNDDQQLLRLLRLALLDHLNSERGHVSGISRPAICSQVAFMFVEAVRHSSFSKKGKHVKISSKEMTRMQIEFRSLYDKAIHTDESSEVTPGRQIC